MIAGTAIDAVTMEQAANAVAKAAMGRSKRPDGKSRLVVPVNVDVCVKAREDDDLARILKEADAVLPDGKPLLWIAKAQGEPFPEKVSGSDLVPLVLDRVGDEGGSLFVLGGTPTAAKTALANATRDHAGLKAAGWLAPGKGFENDDAQLMAIDEAIRAAKPSVLLVCLGCPKQEKWAASRGTRDGAGVAICAGATVDFMAGTAKRAPKWASDVGMEWFWRFAHEPKRLFKRYFVDDPKIFLVAAIDHAKRKRLARWKEENR